MIRQRACILLCLHPSLLGVVYKFDVGASPPVGGCQKHWASGSLVAGLERVPVLRHVPQETI